MPRNLKVVITGPYNAGKTRFIKTISEIDVVSTERKITRRAPGSDKAQTTVAMDYGRVTLGDDVLHLNGTPGQARFDFMWEILTREMNGFVLLIDSCAEASLAEAQELVRLFSEDHAVPYVIAANKQDLDCALPPERLRRAMNLAGDTLIMPCVATRKTSVRQVLAQIAQSI